MQISGADFLQVLTDEAYDQEVLPVADQAAVDLDQLFDRLGQQVENPKLMQLTVTLNGGVAEGGTNLTLETNVINLPLRYQNQLKKLVYADQDYEVNLYMYVENADVSKSHLKITKVSSVTAYVDDPDSGQQKISAWFDQELAHIVEVQKESDEAPED
ncbi:hypothetical protein OZX65_02285 [Leuconostocaceae bacterium ESL0723]|nr:hypothetical protein [Lactobacillaceae bacterium L1_55_11]WEV54908.1 hypothetical protein OZX65_02285 [Leuconostocaceae bacterium ESL0723]